MSSSLYTTTTKVPGTAGFCHSERSEESEILHRFALQDDKLHRQLVHPVQSTCGGQDDKLAGCPFHKESFQC